MQLLLAAVQEGRLYLQETRTDYIEDLGEAVYTYVCAINDYVTPEWQPYINDVWRAIITDGVFAPMLLMHKGRNQGRLNRYVITNIVFHLRALDIYQCDSLLELHKRMEGVSQKNGIYKAAGAYCLSRAQRQRLRELKNIIAGQK